MNDKELVLYRNILTKMKEHKRIYSYLYNNKNYEFISKKDINDKWYNTLPKGGVFLWLQRDKSE